MAYRFAMAEAGSVERRSPSANEVLQSLVEAGADPTEATIVARELDGLTAPQPERQLANGVSVRLDLIGRRRVFTIRWERLATGQG